MTQQRDTIYFDIIDNIGRWWFRIENTKGDVLIQYMSSKAYNEHNPNAIVLEMSFRSSITTSYQTDFIDKYKENGVLIVNSDALTWEYHKLGKDPITITVSRPVLAPTYYVVGSIMDHTPHTTFLNYVEWLKYQPSDVRDDLSDELLNCAETL